MKNPAENRMGFLDSSCLLKQSLVSSLLLLFVVPFFSYPVLSPAFVTVTVLIVSSATAVLVLFKSSKNKRVSDRNEVLLVDGDTSSCRPEAPPKEESENSAAPEANDAAPVPVKSPEVSSETESVDLSTTTTTDESDDVDWPSPYNADHRIRACSDDSISDDDSLIELALPDGHYVEPVPASPKLTPPRLNSPEYSPESVFGRHGLLELFSDINEEDNMIEIDISMGSIKCSRLEIEA